MSKLLFYGGPILTMASPLYAPALLVEGGTIAALGSREELAALAPDARPVPLEGRALLPGFLDAHSHFTGVAIGLGQPSVAQARSFGDIQSLLARHIRENGLPPGAWITLRDLDWEDLAEKRPPSRQVLDRAAPQNPVVLSHRSGHTGVFNTAALEALGVGADTPDPSGGRFAREGGELTGYAEENAFLTLQRQVPMPGPQTLLDQFRRAQALYAAQGFTTLQEGAVSDDMLPLYRFLLSSGLLDLDLVAYGDMARCAAFFGAFPSCLEGYEGHFRLGGYKLFLDGSPQARTAWLRAPYAGSQDRGVPTLSDQALGDRLRQAVGERRQVLAHCNGDGAAEQFLTQLAQAGRPEELRALRPVMVHAQLLGRDQLPRLRDLGVIPSFFPAHVYHWGEVHLRNLGAARASAISPAASAGRLGLPYTFHQDSPVLPPSALEPVQCAVLRRTAAGRLLGGEERISTLEALRAVTLHAAFQYHEEGTKGSLAPGRRADLVILDRDPLAVPPEELTSLQVLATLKDGRPVYQRS